MLYCWLERRAVNFVVRLARPLVHVHRSATDEVLLLVDILYGRLRASGRVRTFLGNEATCTIVQGWAGLHRLFQKPGNTGLTVATMEFSMWQVVSGSRGWDSGTLNVCGTRSHAEQGSTTSATVKSKSIGQPEGAFLA